MKVRDINYHVETFGTGPALMMLHGFTGSSVNWYPLAEQLSDNFQVILVDIIGHGNTEKPRNVSRYSMEEVVRDIKEILVQLEIHKVNLLGYSMGGRVALSFAVTYPESVERLILESSSPGLKTIEERINRCEADQKLARKIESNGIEWFVKMWSEIPLFSSQRRLSDDLLEKQYELRMRNDSYGLVNSLRGMGTGSQPSLWDQLQDLSMPILIITGNEDEKFCNIAKEMTKKMKNAKNIVVNSAGHAIHLEQLQIFAKIVVDDLT
ncbi:2-succinyl-6-hydroxy-2,4-cyclohexadiene-1-carboxylate synthase [Bacillus solimangrovi]|uniref:Putative 2-succinyl-6-hydroxy-2,4-cyclohexadiene-1-carboxylate synthase n=1 Tax=Bacillus solimangrovi TaxID=1305675 RepID=A0A1E5LGE4_9BACI|nr:2-succinyl-6-hydroxy-2,4-cyclohexadiene-1-carboxylate synthase [Bacillus solimangrovi]OEH93144.1 2-succinyl-6-hydroxy-2,4-cyclohexadiene-1-carboxylate synthase [Bacillus solimangrovi]